MAALHKLRADAMRGIVVALVVAGLRVAGARRNVASRETEEGKGLNTLPGSRPGLPNRYDLNPSQVKSSQVKSSHFKSIHSQKSGRRDIDLGIRLLLFLYTRINRVIT